MVIIIDNIDKPLYPEERKELIEVICSRWSKEGFEKVEKGSHLHKYTPLYHFLFVPQIKNDSFISVTELFGNTDMEDRQHDHKHHGGLRLQYLGNFDGLQKVLVQGVSPGFDMSSPALMLYSVDELITNEERISFDKALLYLEKVTRYSAPDFFHLDSRTEYYPSTFHVF